MSRIACAACLVALALAGCGGSPTRRTHGPPLLPRTLARAWEQRANAIAAAAGHGAGCRAQQLASSLRTEVITDAGRIPSQLYAPLLESVNSLADRIVCTPPTTTVTLPKQPKGPKQHGPPHGHGHGGDQGKQGNQG